MIEAVNVRVRVAKATDMLAVLCDSAGVLWCCYWPKFRCRPITTPRAIPTARDAHADVVGWLGVGESGVGFNIFGRE